jgi:hypothetical protein
VISRALRSATKTLRGEMKMFRAKCGVAARQAAKGARSRRPDAAKHCGRRCKQGAATQNQQRRAVPYLCRYALEQAPKKLIDFFDKSLLQHFDFERFLIVRTIPFERKAL